MWAEALALSPVIPARFFAGIQLTSRAASGRSYRCDVPARIVTRMLRAVEHDMRALDFFFEGIWYARPIKYVDQYG